MAGMTFTADLKNLQAMFDFIKEGSGKQGFDAATMNKVQLACEEALVNIITYAYPEQNGCLEIIYINKKEGLEIQIIDSGVPFDPLLLKAPDLKAPLGERNIGGLGIYLMRNMVDEVKYLRENEHNILTFIKYNAEIAEKKDPLPILNPGIGKAD